MKKTNFLTFLFLCLSISVVLFIMFIRSTPAAEPDAAIQNSHESTGQTALSPDSGDGHPQEIEPSVSETGNTGDGHSDQKTEDPPAPASPPGNILFIGDSRTVGLSEYALLDNIDYFANIGMTVYNVLEETISVPTVGKVTLSELLSYKVYDSIYVMLGVNELGYSMDSILAKYEDLLTFIQESQPNAAIIINANLHVTKSRSDNDAVINNQAIDELNAAISAFADNNTIFYLDSNELFDDENGCLSAEKSEDGAHLYAKYYVEWGDWIMQQAKTLMKEDSF